MINVEGETHVGTYKEWQLPFEGNNPTLIIFLNTVDNFHNSFSFSFQKH